MATTQTAPKPTGKKKAKRRSKLHVIIPTLMALAGMLLLLYPVVSTRVNNARQQKVAEAYENSVSRKSDLGSLQKQLERADKYNKDLASGVILDPFIEDAVPTSPEYQQYLKVLNMQDVMGIIRIPSIKVSLPIYHGTFGDTLDKGVGHLFGSSLPIGGPDTHSVLTGHTGLQNATLFDHLDQLKKGDVFYIDVYGRKLKYRITDIRVVLPFQTQGLHRVAGKDLVTLITCTPYGINTHRLLVTGERTYMDAYESESVFGQQHYDNPWTWWMILIVAFASVVALAFLALLIAALRRRRKNKKAAAAAAANQALPRKSVHDKVEGTDASDAAPTDSE